MAGGQPQKPPHPDYNVIAQLRLLVPLAKREGLLVAADFIESFLKRNIKPGSQ